MNDAEQQIYATLK